MNVVQRNFIFTRWLYISTNCWTCIILRIHDLSFAANFQSCLFTKVSYINQIPLCKEIIVMWAKYQFLHIFLFSIRSLYRNVSSFTINICQPNNFSTKDENVSLRWYWKRMKPKPINRNLQLFVWPQKHIELLCFAVSFPMIY